MEFIVIGLNHKTASVEMRERLAFQEGRIEEALGQCRSLASLRENMILSTCNRVEICAVALETEKAGIDLKSFLAQYHQIPLKDFEKYLYVISGQEAVRHVFRVASSLDSMVQGEPQILGQIKDAYSTAAQSKACGLLLNKLLHRAFHVAKRVRTETRIGNSAVSVSFVAVELAKKIFDTLEKRTVLLIGAGEMCELAARHLVSGGATKVMVTNRTHERAVALAKEFSGEAIPFDDIAQGLLRADIVISSTGADHHILTHDQVSKALRDRKQKPIFFIDMAVPRNIDPSVDDIENAYLYNMDDLEGVVNQNIEDRKQEAEKAEAIVEEEVTKFVHWYRTLDITPTIVALRKKFEEIRKKELEKTLSLHPDLSEKEKKSLEALTSAIINKILHQPLTLIKQGQENGAAELYLDTLRTLFGLPENFPGPAPEENLKEIPDPHDLK